MEHTIRIPSGLATLSVDVAGEGQPVIFLHANVCDKRMWAAQVSALRGTHMTVAYDRRGFGKTDFLAEAHSPMSDLFAVMDTVSPDQPAVLVACSGGCKIAIDAAIEYPSRVKALILISPTVSGSPDPTYTPAVKLLIDAQANAAREQDLDKLNAIKAHLWLDGPLGPVGRVKGNVRDLFLDMNGTALSAPFPGDSTDTTSMYGRLGEINVPVLLVWGSLDFPHIQSRTNDMVGLVKKGVGLRFEGAAHLSNLEQPMDFNKALIDFLAEGE